MGSLTEMTFSQTIAASPEAVYYAITNGAALREWMSTSSQVDSREGGRIYLWWQQGYFAAGEFEKLVPEKKVVHSWQGRNETAVSRVTYELSPVDGGTLLTVIHGDLPAGEAFAEMRQGLKEGWEAGLPNLKSVLETGLDKRIYERAFLGILISGVVTAEQAGELGLDAAGGIRINGTMDGTGAAAAGLQANDIIVDLGGQETKDFGTLQAAIRPYRPGDSVKVTFYRNGERQQTLVEMATRPVPEIPATPDALAAAVEAAYAQLDEALNEAIDGATEAEAEYRADDKGWNVKELLAHLVTSERGVQMGAATQITDGILDGFPNNPDAWVRSVTAAYPTLAELVELWKRTEAETVALLANLPESVVARKATYQNIGNGFLIGLAGHTQAHIAEIKSLLAAAREALAETAVPS